MTLEELEEKRKRLLFRAAHRGTRELDILMGGFAQKEVPSMDEKALEQFEEILHISDPDVYGWVVGQTLWPRDLRSSVAERLVEYFHGKDTHNQ